MKNKIELAKYIIDLKIAKEIKENKEKNFQNFSQNILNLKNEKNEIFKNNQEVIEKILTQYLNEVR